MNLNIAEQLILNVYQYPDYIDITDKTEECIHTTGTFYSQVFKHIDTNNYWMICWHENFTHSAEQTTYYTDIKFYKVIPMTVTKTEYIIIDEDKK